MPRMTDEALGREVERWKRSRFYTLRKKDSHGNLKVRRYHVPVIPSYREVNSLGVPVKIQLPKDSRFAYINTVEVRENGTSTVDLWFLAPKQEVDDIRTFLISMNDQVIEPPEGHHLIHLGSDTTPDHEVIVHAFEVKKTER